MSRLLRRAGPRVRVGLRLLPFALATAAASLVYAVAAQGGAAPPLVEPRQPHGDGAVQLSGELRQWHPVTLTLNGPFAHERDRAPNPFTDYRFTVTFRHASGQPEFVVPGYFAADGRAAETSAEAGTRWRAHLSPDKAGRWTYTVHVTRGADAALETASAGAAVAPFDGKSGSFEVRPTNRTGRDFRNRGRLQYVGGHFLRFAGSGEHFLKAGPDSPETLLACSDFDGTVARKANVPLKTWAPHVRDWRPGDPAWKNGRGKGIIGALNYLAASGCNVFSFLPYNAGGDGDNVWPFVSRNERRHYDCSRLDQWGIVFDHAQKLGLFLHFKLQEQENDDNRTVQAAAGTAVETALDGGDLGPTRKLYCRELIARFGHALALNWNLGEENTQSTEQQLAMAGYLQAMDPYDHLVVVHTFPNAQDRVYTALLGKTPFTGASLQNGWDQVHRRTLQWVNESERAGRPWVVANDEQGPADLGVPPDPGYAGHSGVAEKDGKKWDLHSIRKATLWGNVMAGGAGVEYYFGYRLPQNDLVCEDFRSRERSWKYCRLALEFFHAARVPFWEMKNADALVGNKQSDNSRYCLAKPGDLYLVYLPQGGEAQLDLGAATGRFEVRWFNPREGGPLQNGSVAQVSGRGRAGLGLPPADPGEDWLVVVRRRSGG